MSLEQAINDLTAAVKANTEALGKGGTAPEATKAPKAAEAAEATEAPKAADKPADKPSGKKATTLDMIAKRFGAYMSAEGDEAKANVRQIVKHFKVTKISNLAEDQFDVALAMLDQIEAGEDPFGGGGDDDDADDLM